MEPVTLSTIELCVQTGATYRQIDYWTSYGVIPPPDGKRGSGFRRRYDQAIVPAVRCVVRISAALRSGHQSGANMDLLADIFKHYNDGYIPIGDHAALVWVVET